MLEDIELKKFPHSSGVYFFRDVDGVIIYVGSSKDLYIRMALHRTYIKKGNNHGTQKGIYQFLQSNQFTVEFQLEENYKQIEQELIGKYNPKYNEKRAFAGCGVHKGREVEYWKEYKEKYKEEILKRDKQYRESHKEEMKQYYNSHKEEKKQYYESHKEEKKQYSKQYSSQLCNFNGEILTLNALRIRFQKQGILHPVLEAKKYIVS